MTEEVKFRVLGALDVTVAGQHLPFGRRRDRLVLGYLLIHAGRAVSLDRLTEVAWFGACAPVSARNGIQVAMSRLRQALPRVPIRSTGDSYLIDIDPHAVDMFQFRALVAAARDQPDRAIDLLHQAEALWRGPILVGTIDDQARERMFRGIGEERINAIEERIDHELARDNHQQVVPELTTLVAAHPTRERLTSQLMVALYRSGRAAEALRVFRDARDTLVETLGVDPSPHLRELEIAILRHDTALLRPVPAPVPEPSPTIAVPAQLPPLTRGFTGRDDQLAALDRMLADAVDGDALPVIVVSGMAGVGKTALALRWAHRLAARYPDGQLYLDLRGHTSDKQIGTSEALSTLLRCLGVPASEIPAEPTEATALFRSRCASRKLLILLDNAGSAEQIEPLLPGTPTCLAIVTSRNSLAPLDVHIGALRQRLEALRPAESAKLITALIGGDRAAAEPVEVNEIAELCAHLPLALRIAGARLSDQPERGIAWYRDELAGHHRLDALRLGDPSTLAVRDAFEVSFRHLPASAQRTFRHLGLVPGPTFSTEMVAVVADLPPAEAGRDLALLTAASLLRHRRDARYDFHDLIREYASELSASVEDRDGVYARLYQWYADRAAAVANLLYAEMTRMNIGTEPAPFATETEASSWLDLEFPSLQAAIRDGIRLGQPTQTARITDEIRGYLVRHAPIDTWMAIADCAMAATEVTGDLRARAAVEINRATAYGRHGTFELAARHYRTAIEHARASDWADGERNARTNLATILVITGPLTAAREQLESALDRLDGGARLPSNAYNNLMVVLRDLGLYREALVQAKTANSVPIGPFARADVMEATGVTYHYIGEYENAQRCLDDALRIQRQLGDERSVVMTLASLAELARDRGRPDRARELLQHSITGAQRHHVPSAEAKARNVKATIAVLDGNVRSAMAESQVALTVARSAGIRREELRALIGLAVAHRLLGRLDEAAAHARTAAELAEVNGFAPLAAQAGTELARIEHARLPA